VASRALYVGGTFTSAGSVSGTSGLAKVRHDLVDVGCPWGRRT